jgi:hypothetical protein
MPFMYLYELHCLMRYISIAVAMAATIPTKYMNDTIAAFTSLSCLSSLLISVAQRLQYSYSFK